MLSQFENFTPAAVDGTVDPARFMAALGEAFANYASPELKAQTVGAPIGPYVHGPGGLFGVRGLSRGVISAHTQVRGVAGRLPFQPSRDATPLFPYITGFVRSDQQEKDGVCDNPPPAGGAKTCILTTVWGRKEFMTRQLEINAVGDVINRGEFDDLILENGPLVQQMGGLVNQFFALQNQAQALKAGREMVMRMAEVAVAYQRWFCPQLYTGNPANSAAGGGYREFMGLDLLISTTKIDAVSGQACTALESLVRDFNYQDVQASNQDPSIVRTLTAMFRLLYDRAEHQLLDEVMYVMAMRRGLFDALVDVWPCIYETYRCVFPNSNASAGMSLNDDHATQMRDAMRTGKYLIIDGQRIPVWTDKCIAEETAADDGDIPVGSFSSDIYILPISARNGTLRTLYFEHFPYNDGPMQTARDGRAASWFWTDRGIFMWGVKPPDNWCLELISKVEPRLILKTPQLAARLQNCVYTPLIHYDDVLPSSEYWRDGGISTGYPPSSPYAEYNLAGPGINP